MKAYRFGPFRLDTAQGILAAGESEIPLSGKPFEVLRCLVENAGRIVAKSELIDQVWPDSHVEENSLAQSVSLVRRTLACFDDAEYIQTLPRRGYRFAIEVIEEDHFIDLLIGLTSSHPNIAQWMCDRLIKRTIETGGGGVPAVLDDFPEQLRTSRRTTVADIRAIAKRCSFSPSPFGRGSG